MVRLEELVGCGLDERAAVEFFDLLEGLDGSPEARWRVVVSQLRPDHPFALHQLLYQAIYGDAGGPVYFPKTTAIERAHVTALQRELGLSSYQALYAWSVAEREAFWQRTVTRLGIGFKKTYTRLVDFAQDTAFFPPP